MPMPRETKAEHVVRILTAALVANTPAERGAAFDALRKKLPPGVPHELLTRFWAAQMRVPAVYHRLRVTPDEYMPAVLAGLRRWRAPAATFLVTAVADEPTPDALRAANRAFYVIANSPTPYTPKGRAGILATLTHPPYLVGAQAVVAAHGWRGDAYAFPRALVFDGGDTSVATLRPWFEAAVAAGDADQADRKELMKFAKYASTPSMAALFAELG
jgi:hypothetical protein